jgi:hypothetical protein
MLSFSGSLKVFVAVEPCDMRNHSECPIIPSTPVRTSKYRNIDGLI